MINDPKLKAELQKEYDMLAERARHSKEQADQIRAGLKEKQAVLNSTEANLLSAQSKAQKLETEIKQLMEQLKSTKAEVTQYQDRLNQVHAETASLAQQLGPVAQKQKRFEEALAMVRQNISDIAPSSGSAPVPPPPKAPPAPPASRPQAAAAKRQARVPLEMELSFEIDLGKDSEHNFYTGLANNISEGGVFISTTQVLDIGTKLKFPIILPGMSQPEVVGGAVRWVRREGRAEENVPSGIGIQFTEISPNLKKQINHYIQNRESIFYEE